MNDRCKEIIITMIMALGCAMIFWVAVSR